MHRIGKHRNSGNALVVVLVIIVAMAGMAAAFMQFVDQDQRLSLSAARGTRVGYIAEAGVTEALVDVIAGGDGDIGTEGAPIPFGGGGYWVDTTDNGDGTFEVVSYGRIDEKVRAVQVVLAPNLEEVFTKALFGDLDLGASGEVFTDSYDADLGTYASQAVNVDPVTGKTYAKAEGALGSNSNIVISGGVTVLGDATPGPGGSVIISGGSAYVSGSTAPAPAATPMPLVGYNPTIASAGAYSNNSSITFTDGVYRFDSFTAAANAKVTFDGDVEIYIDGNVSVEGQAQFIVNSGAKVRVFTNGDTFTLKGKGLLNVGEVPSAFKIYTNATNVTAEGTSAFHGAIYAPQGIIDPGGTTNVHGSFVGREIVIDGSANFHYDEALAKTPNPISSLRPVSWRRVSVAEIN